MSNARAQNVWVIDTTGQISGSYCIDNIKLIGGSGAATLTIKADDTNGAVVYQARAAISTDNYDHDIELELKNGFYVTISGTGAKAYLYLD